MPSIKLGAICATLALSLAGWSAGAKAGVIYDTSAAGELSGSRSVGGGLTIGGGNATTASLTWSITPIIGGYHYSYTFQTDSHQNSISHFILDISDSCISGGALTDAKCVYDVADGNATLKPGAYTSGNGNPHLPGTIVGVKFDAPSANALPFTFSFDSDRAPVYGDFYANNGNGNSNGYAVFNAGQGNHASTLFTDFIARPDTTVVNAPEPASLAMMSAGLFGLGFIRHRRRRT